MLAAAKGYVEAHPRFLCGSSFFNGRCVAGKVVRRLLERRGSPNTISEGGSTALSAAVKHGHTGIVALLKNSHARVDAWSVYYAVGLFFYSFIYGCLVGARCWK